MIALGLFAAWVKLCCCDTSFFHGHHHRSSFFNVLRCSSRNWSPEEICRAIKEAKALVYITVAWAVAAPFARAAPTSFTSPASGEGLRRQQAEQRDADTEAHYREGIYPSKLDEIIGVQVVQGILADFTLSPCSKPVATATTPTGWTQCRKYGRSHPQF